MMISEPQLVPRGGRSHSPPMSIRETTDEDRTKRAAEKNLTTPVEKNQDPEKTLHMDNDFQENSTELITSRPAQGSPQTAGQPSPLDDFGAEDEEYISGFKLFAALFGVASVFFIVLLDFSITSTAIPYITSDFHTLQDIGWYGSAYVLSSAALQPLTGKLYTYLSVKEVFLCFVAIFEIGSLLCAVSTSSTFFILGRTVAGLGSSGLENGALTLIAGAVPRHKRPFYNGIVFGVCQTGIIVGPLIGGALTQYVSWRWCFYINLPIGAVSGLFLFFTHIPDETLKPPFSFALLRGIIPHLDLTGFALFAPTTVMFLLALQWGSEHGWSEPLAIGLFVGSGVSLALFTLWERRKGEDALMPFHLIKKRIVWASTVQNASLFVNNFVGVNYVPMYFQAVKGVGPSLSGVYTLPSILTQVVALVVSGALVSRLGYYLPFSILAGATTTIACGLISTWNPNTTTAEWIGYQILFGLRGLGLQTAITSIQNAVPAAQSPSAIAFVVFIENLTAAVFTIAGNVIFTKTLVHQITRLAPSVSPSAALAAGGGAEAVRGLLPKESDELGGLLLAFSKAVNSVFYLLAALAGVSFLAAWGMGWVDTRKRNTAEEEEDETG